MAGGHVAPAPSNNPAILELEGVLARIGVTAAHKQIIALILVGCLFDAFEQNTIGIVGPALRTTWGLNAANIGFLNTVTFGSAAIGRLLSGFISDRYGRRTMLGVNLILFTIGSLGCALSPNFAVLCFFRAVVGFGVGGEVSTAVTMLSEFCSPKFRGTAAGLVNVGAGGLGNFLAPAFGLLIFSLFRGAENWRWLFASLAVPCLLVVFYRRLVPETPRFLVSQGKIGEANRVLSILASGSLNPHRVITTAYLTQRSAVEHVKTPPSWASIFQPPYLGRTISVAIAILMSYGAQLSVLTLMPTIFVGMGYNYSSSLLYTLIIQAGSLCGTIAASVFGYHLPRKRVLTFGAILACVAALCIAYLGTNIYLVLLFGALFQFFVLLLNTSIWIYAPELYPTRMRAFGVAFILAAGSAAGSLIPPISGALLDAYGLLGVFGLAAFMYVVFAISIQFGPETYGKSMEDATQPAELFNPPGLGAPELA
jgi:putative MFS transporter